MEPTAWQAFSAMWLVERSGFGLNALLGLIRGLAVQNCARFWGNEKRDLIRREEVHGVRDAWSWGDVGGDVITRSSHFSTPSDVVDHDLFSVSQGRLCKAAAATLEQG